MKFHHRQTPLFLPGYLPPPLQLPRGATEIKRRTAFGGWWGRIQRADGSLSKAQWLGFPQEEYTLASRRRRRKADEQAMIEHKAAAAQYLPLLQEAIRSCVRRGFPRLTNSACNHIVNQCGFGPQIIVESADTSIGAIVETIVAELSPNPQRVKL